MRRREPATDPLVRHARMNTWTRASFGVLLLLAALAGCGGDEDEAKPITGTFVGKVSDTDAFVAVVAAPAREGMDRGE